MQMRELEAEHPATLTTANNWALPPTPGLSATLGSAHPHVGPNADSVCTATQTAATGMPRAGRMITIRYDFIPNRFDLIL